MTRPAALLLVPVSFADACAFVAEWHRHHEPPIGHKFSIGVAAAAVLVGVVMVGRPVARHFDNGRTLEVLRTATDGTANANSMLYGAAWRAAKALGYDRLITYTQAGESGVSLRAAGWSSLNAPLGRAGMCRRVRERRRTPTSSGSCGRPRDPPHPGHQPPAHRSAHSGGRTWLSRTTPTRT